MNDTPERWLSIPGYEGRYDVSDLGRVRSWVQHGGPHILKPWLDHRGYRIVNLGRGAHRKIHLLVLLAFVGPQPAGLVTRHLDGDPAHNHLGNLLYDTQSENRLDAVRHGTDHNTAKTHCPSNHEYDAANTYIYPNGRRGCRICARDALIRFKSKNRTAQKGMI